MLNAIIEIVNLGLIPQKYIDEILVKLKISNGKDEDKNSEQYKNSGYGSDNIVKNLGIVFIIGIVGAIIIGLILLCKWLFMKFET